MLRVHWILGTAVGAVSFAIRVVVDWLWQGFDCIRDANNEQTRPTKRRETNMKNRTNIYTAVRSSLALAMALTEMIQLLGATMLRDERLRRLCGGQMESPYCPR